MTSQPDEPHPQVSPSPQESAAAQPSLESGAAPRPRFKIQWGVPTRTLPVLSLLLLIGSIALFLTFLTVHRRSPAEFRLDPTATRTNFTINYWIDHGYFHSGGLQVRPDGSSSGGTFIYLSSTGGHLISGFLVEKIYKAVTGHTSVRLQAIQNEAIALLVSVALGLLAFRLARRINLPPLHALVLAAAVQLVHFTFPDNLAVFWELSGRQPFLFFAVLFLLIEERSIESRTTAMNIAQAVAAFLMTYMEYIAGGTFLVSYVVVSAILSSERVSVRRILAVTALPLLLAFGIFAGQRSWVKATYPNAQKYGATFAFRSGLDGSTQYYGDHLDIAYKRDLARVNFKQNQQYLFRWQWTFFAGTAALLTVLILGARGRVPQIALIAVLSLLGSYLLYAAVFSQAIVIHPYLFDILLFTPLSLALLVLAPALLESSTMHRGVFVATVFFLAAWLCMVQLRAYAMRYPTPPAPVDTASER